MTPTIDIFICKTEYREILKAGHFHNLGGIARDGYSLKSSMQHYSLSLISNHYQMTSYEHVNTYQTQLKQATICPWDLHSNPLVPRKSDAVCKSSRLYFQESKKKVCLDGWWFLLAVCSQVHTSNLKKKSCALQVQPLIKTNVDICFCPEFGNAALCKALSNKTTINSSCSREWAHPGQSKIALEPKAKKSCFLTLWALRVVITLAGK